MGLAYAWRMQRTSVPTLRDLGFTSIMRGLGRRIPVALAALGCLASAPSLPPCPPQNTVRTEYSQYCMHTSPATMFVVNNGAKTTTIEVQTLRHDATLRCKDLDLTRAACQLTPDQLSPARRLPLLPGEYTSLDEVLDTCPVVLIKYDEWQPPVIAINYIPEVTWIPSFSPNPPGERIKGGIYVAAEGSVVGTTSEIIPAVCEDVP